MKRDILDTFSDKLRKVRRFLALPEVPSIARDVERWKFVLFPRIVYPSYRHATSIGEPQHRHVSSTHIVMYRMATMAFQSLNFGLLVHNAKNTGLGESGEGYSLKMRRFVRKNVLQLEIWCSEVVWSRRILEMEPGLFRYLYTLMISC